MDKLRWVMQQENTLRHQTSKLQAGEARKDQPFHPFCVNQHSQAREAHRTRGMRTEQRGARAAA